MCDHARGRESQGLLRPSGFMASGMIAWPDLVTVYDYSLDMALIPTNTVQSLSCRNDFLFQLRY